MEIDLERLTNVEVTSPIEAVIEDLDKKLDNPQDSTVKEPIKEDKVEESPIEAKLDENGNVVDGEGKVLYKKDEFEIKDGEVVPKESKASVVDSLLKSLKDEEEFEPLDDKGQPLSLKDVPEVDALKTVVLQAAQLGAKNGVESLFQKHPEAKLLINHLQQGKPFSEFISNAATADYNQMKVETVSEQKSVLFDFFTKVSLNDATTANMLIDTLEARKELETKAQNALSALQQKQKSEIAEADRQMKEREETRKSEVIKYWGEVSKTIKTGKLGEISLPEKEQSEFYSWMTVPVKNGRTQSQLDEEGLTVERELMLEYLRFKKFNLSDLVKAEVSKKEVENLHKRKVVISETPQKLGVNFDLLK